VLTVVDGLGRVTTPLITRFLASTRGSHRRKGLHFSPPVHSTWRWRERLLSALEAPSVRSWP
jgi:hypothetical protein